MGQVALGFKNLLIKAAVFFVMAALLAWALGGTLWPRAEVSEFDPVVFAGRDWYWRLAVGGRNVGEVKWTLMTFNGDEEPRSVDERRWVEVAGPVTADEKLYFAGRASFNAAEPWRIGWVTAADREVTYVSMPDRLAVEQQLARVREGLPLQTVQEILQQRPAILEPAPEFAEETEGP